MVIAVFGGADARRVTRVAIASETARTADAVRMARVAGDGGAP